jgi:hypothetical protein
VEVLLCRACGGRLRLIATILDPRTIRDVLHSPGLATELPIGPRLAHTPADTGDRSGLICTHSDSRRLRAPSFRPLPDHLRLPADLEFHARPCPTPKVPA